LPSVVPFTPATHFFFAVSHVEIILAKQGGGGPHVQPGL
jgi:hypothetical protein